LEKNYLIFTNKKTCRRLVFYPVAKNANTSAKFFLAKHLGIEEKFYFLEDKIPRFKLNKELLKNYKKKYNIIDFLPPYSRFEKLDVEERACLIRDPLKRFISAYKNRVLFHKDKNFHNHSVNQILEKLENGLFENKHFLPQTYWLGNDLEYFTIKANVENLEPFVKSINNFFSNNLNFPRMQTGGQKNDLHLNQDQKTKIKKIYSEDYDLVSNYI
tara:strand:+ start:23971 stop:24615 length:645 start_codon:yes stop_codon:yes gene_type:complete